MSILKTGIITALSALGLFAAAPAHAQEYYYRPATIARPVRQTRAARYRRVWSRGRYVRQPIYQYQYQQYPQYQYAQPVDQYRQYPQYPQYAQPAADNGCSAFGEEVRAELASIEDAVRARVAAGELDGNALTAMESARDDLLQDLVDLSAKGYVTDADRAHVERDLELLRAKFGC